MVTYLQVKVNVSVVTITGFGKQATKQLKHNPTKISPRDNNAHLSFG